MRTRYLKPGFFENEDLARLPATTRLLFAGLWLIADKQGRLRDRPARIKGELFPYDNTNVERGLRQLAEAGFICRYERDGQRLIWIPSWSRHQRPHPHEPASTLPAHPNDQCSGDVITLPGLDPPGTINADEDSYADEDGNEDAGERTPAQPPPDLKAWQEVKPDFENLFGFIGGEAVKKAREYAVRVPAEWFREALGETRAKAERPSWKYTQAILDRWISEGRGLEQPRNNGKIAIGSVADVIERRKAKARSR